MMNFLHLQTQSPTPALRKKAEREAILSACTGVTGEITLTDSAVIILFASTLGAGDMFSMLTTALLPLLNGLCIIPMACLVPRFGLHGLILRVCTLSFLCYLILVCSPFFGGAAVAVMLLSLFLFSVLQTGYVAGWIPLMDSFLTPERRGGFLGKMRFCWQLTSAGFLFLAGLFIGRDPSLGHLQAILLLAALIYSGRILFIARIPVLSSAGPVNVNFRKGLKTALENKPLTGFSVYLFALNLAAFGTIPLTTLYLKNQLHAPDNIIIILSAVTLAGMLTGSVFAGHLLEKYKIKRVLLGIHLTYILTNGALFLIFPDALSPGTVYTAIGILLFIYSFCFANANIATTSEMMALATPGNKAMAMAFCGAFYYSASGLSRLLSSLILGAGILNPQWQWGGYHFCLYQTFYLVYTAGLVLAGLFLILVPAVFPRGQYSYKQEVGSRKQEAGRKIIPIITE